jgi:hypothetical protein
VSTGAGSPTGTAALRVRLLGAFELRHGETALPPLGSARAGRRCGPTAPACTPYFLSDEGAVGVQAAYGSRLRRLTALKDRYDPTNLFRMNANIAPSRPGRR